jgi:DNA-binding transcriptional MerR regulator
VRVNTHIVTPNLDDPATTLWTIEGLGNEVGLAVSTIRLYQNMGLLAPPTKRGRIGYYADRHIERLRAIAQLQGRGFSLAGIKDLFDNLESGDSLRSVVGLGAGNSIWSAEAPETMSLVELAGHLPSLEFTPEVVRRVMELGLVEFSPDGVSVVVRSPSFLKIGSELAALGVPADEILDEYEQLRAQADEIARRFTDLFRRRMWSPFVTRGMPVDQIPPLLATLDQLAPLAEQVATMSLRHALQSSAEAFIKTEAADLGIDIPAGVDAGRAVTRSDS